MESVVEILEKYGWVQGIYKSSDNHHCLVGAVAERLGIGLDSEWIEWEKAKMPAQKAVLILDPSLEPDRMMAECWNDMPGRSYEEVLLAAKHADRIIEEMEMGVD